MRQLPEIMGNAIKEQSALDAGPQKDDLVFTGLMESLGTTFIVSPPVLAWVRGEKVDLHGDPNPLVNLPSGEYVVIVTIRKAPVKS